jgi:hypothetical protein
VAEVDVAALSRKVYGGAGGVHPGLLTVAEWKYIARRLEERERLREVEAEARKVCGSVGTVALCRALDRLDALAAREGAD